MSLKEYKNKRNFNKTSEPQGKVTKPKNKKNLLKFVIQYHQARAKHYDFRLEWNGALLSWAVPKGLSLNPKDKRLAVMVEDHPLDYADFEGIIPKGNYGAGSVEIFDSGNYLPVYDFDAGFKKGHLKFVLNGKKFKGEFSLVKIDDKNWLIIKSADEFSVETAKQIKEKTEITMNINKLPFKTCPPQLATLTHNIPKGKNWLFEIKYDGYRIISFVENGKVKMLSRNGKDYATKFERIKKSLLKLNLENCVLDGEVVVFDENGRSDFGLLQNNIKSPSLPFYYVIFDLLALDGNDLRDLPLIERKKKLEQLLVKADNDLVYSSFVVGKGAESFKMAKKNNLEGIIAKKVNAPYTSKRTEDWLKIKCYLRQEFVIGGYATTEKNEVLSALLLGYYDNKTLKFVGKVGTGFSDELKKELVNKFSKFKINKSEFKEIPKQKNVTWLKPNFVCEVQFAELTNDKVLRQPSFIGLREDKKPKDVKLEIKNEW